MTDPKVVQRPVAIEREGFRMETTLDVIVHCEACDIPIDAATNACPQCHVTVGDPCEACGRTMYHTEECRTVSEIEAQARTAKVLTFDAHLPCRSRGGRPWHDVEVDAVVIEAEGVFVSKVWLGRGPRRRDVMRRIPLDVLHDLNLQAVTEHAAFVSSRGSWINR